MYHQGGGYITFAIFRLHHHSFFTHHILLTWQNTLSSNCSNPESIVECSYFCIIFCTIFFTIYCTIFLYHIFSYSYYCTIFSSTCWLEFSPTLGLSWGINARHLFNLLVTLFYIFLQKVEWSLDLNGIFILQEITSVFLIFFSYLPPTALISTVGVETILSRFLLQSTG